MSQTTPVLHTSTTPSASVMKTADNAWHLEIAANAKRIYQLAQLDDHGKVPRGDFPWRPPLSLSLQARVSAEDLPGTWGFGLWNYPFSYLRGFDRKPARLPAMPEAAWFFHASAQNHLSFRDDLPANGFLAATFSSNRVPTALLVLASPALALALIPGAAQLIRWLLRRMVRQDAAQIQTRVTEWHSYSLEWLPDAVRLSVDGVNILQTSIAPHAPLSLVIWVDNQYAAFPPSGSLKYGLSTNPEPAWMEIRDLSLLDHV